MAIDHSNIIKGLKSLGATVDESTFSSKMQDPKFAEKVRSSLEIGGATVPDSALFYNKYGNAAKTPEVTQAAPNKSTSDKLSDMLFPTRTKNLDESTGTKLLSIGKDILTAPGRAVAGIGAALGQRASNRWDGADASTADVGVGEAFRSGMTDPEKEIKSSLNEAGIQNKFTRGALEVGAGTAKDPTLVPSLLYGGPVGKGLASAVGRFVVPSAYGAASNLINQATENPGQAINKTELAASTILPAIAGGVLHGVGKGIGGIAEQAKKRLYQIKVLGGNIKTESDFGGYLKKHGEDVIKKITKPEIYNPKPYKSPIITDEAYRLFEANPQNANLSEAAGAKRLKEMQDLIDMGEGRRLDVIDAHKQKMLEEFEKNGIGVKPEDISDVDVANWVKAKVEKAKETFAGAIKQTNEAEAAKKAELRKTLKDKLGELNKAKTPTIGAGALVPAIGAGALAHYAGGGMTGALIGGALTLAAKPVLSTIKAGIYRQPEIASQIARGISDATKLSTPMLASQANKVFQGLREVSDKTNTKK